MMMSAFMKKNDDGLRRMMFGFGKKLFSTKSDSNNSFKSILIANRGEIAVRIARTCKKLGIRSVGVYSDADANSLHVKHCDHAYYLGGNAASESYLRMDKILDIAKKAKVDAIHPGYGFLSENAEFARQCELNKDFVFIGPPSKAILDMGSKSSSKNIMEKAGVPCTPGYHGEDQEMSRLIKEANRCGFPLMLKAFKGGGGKGMRIVETADEFQSNAEACRREAVASFGDSRILLERYLRRPRHIEFQIFADKHGNVIHLFERDCSVQRRHQKVLEESPATFLPSEIRKKMGETAVAAARAVGYVGAGTVEFMLDEDGTYYFMEMNTRLQVEHPVTEMVTGFDLVEWQLSIAAGNRLPITKQEDVKIRDHAIEARVYAENPDNGFLPGSGTLAHLRAPSEDHERSFIRVETGVERGDQVSIFYDPMIAKLVVRAKDRASAIRLMDQKLREYQIAGLTTNLEFLRACLLHPMFQAGGVNTSFLDKHLTEILLSTLPLDNAEIVSLLACLAHTLASFKQAMNTSSIPPGFRVHGESVFKLRYNLDIGRGQLHLLEMNVHVLSASCASSVGKKNFVRLNVERIKVNNNSASVGDGSKLAHIEGNIVQDPLNPHALVFDAVLPHQEQFTKVSAVWVTNPQGRRSLNLFTGAQGKIRKCLFILHEVQDEHDFSYSQSEGSIRAPMPGKIVQVLVKDGDRVMENQPLLIVLAMKMEHPIKANKAGVISSLKVREGDFVDDSKTLLTIT